MNKLFLAGYNFFYPVGALLFSPFLAYKIVTSEKYRTGLREKLSFKLPRHSFCVWIHAVSVGETLAVVPLVEEIKEKLGLSICFSTTTNTGMEVAKSKLSGVVDDFFYFPLDFYPVVKRVVDVVNPQAVLIVETEIWPSLLYICHKKGIPVFMVNGRISDASFSGYSKISWFISPFLKYYSKFFMKSPRDAARIITLGAPEDKVVVTGNIKFASVYKRALSVESEFVRREFGLSPKEQLFTAGSVHPGEEEKVVGVYLKLKNDFPSLKLLLAPRHPERRQEVVDIVRGSGLSFRLRSEGGTFEGCNVLILDTVGELFSLYSISNVVFIGGSLVNVGGHNPLEALVFGRPVIMGPYHHNFTDIVNEVREGIIVVRTENEFYEKAHSILSGRLTFYLDNIMKIFNLSLNTIEIILENLERELHS